MAQFDANTNAPVLPGVQKRYDGTQAETLQSSIIDTQDMEAFTFVFQYDLRAFNAGNTFTVTNARITESDDAGFATSNTVNTDNVNGNLDEFNIDAGTLTTDRYIYKAGAFGTKRYVRLELDVAYTENVASPGPVVYCHVQYNPIVEPING